MPRIELKTDIKATREIVFDLSRSIDLHKISTEQTNESAIAGRTSGLIELGEFVTWRAKHLGLYQNLSSHITEFNQPNYFVDEMKRGIFKKFRHEHHFSVSGEITTMIDVFVYQSPLGFIGQLADIFFLKKYMKNLLEKRNQTIKDFAESGKWKKVLNINFD